MAYDPQDLLLGVLEEFVEASRKGYRDRHLQMLDESLSFGSRLAQIKQRSELRRVIDSELRARRPREERVPWHHGTVPASCVVVADVRVETCPRCGAPIEFRPGNPRGIHGGSGGIRRGCVLPRAG